MYDVAIIGAGPAGIFTALELIRLRPEWKIAIFEKGRLIRQRRCLVREGKKCPPCVSCNLLCGWGGAGAFSDGKLTLSSNVGGNLLNYMELQALQNLIAYTDKIYLEYGADTLIHGLDNEAVTDITRRARLAELKLVHSPIRHMGSDRSLAVLENMQEALKDKIDIFPEEAANSLLIEDNEIKGFTAKSGKTITARHVVVSPGREGAEWITNEFKKFGIGLENNAVDIGVRVEVPATVMEELTRKLYEVKLLYNAPTFGDDVRTFCMNPYGEVVCENYEGITTVNGHSYGEKKTEYTNFALLVSKNFTEPFKEPIAYGQHIARLANMLSGGVLVQRFGDLTAGRRSTHAKIADGTIIPTFKDAVPGDLSLVLPHRHLTSIVEMIYALERIAPGVASRYTLLYGVEVKFYSARIKLTRDLETEGVRNLFAIGDGAGVTRGLIQASVSGVHAARVISAR